jgi:hypothetical protein
MILVLFKNPESTNFTDLLHAAEAELGRRGGCRRVAVCNAPATTDHYSITGWGADAA